MMMMMLRNSVPSSSSILVVVFDLPEHDLVTVDFHVISLATMDNSRREMKLAVAAADVDYDSVHQRHSLVDARSLLHPSH